jgi:hypothetical protein
MLDFARCPSCNGELPVTELWNAASPDLRVYFLSMNTGLECPSCLARLQVVQWPGVLAQIAMLVIFVWSIAPTDRFSKAHGEHNYLATGLFVALLLCRHFFMKRLLGFRVADEASSPNFPLGTRAQREREAAEDRQRLEKERAQDAEYEAEDARGDHADLAGPWRCEKCGEENPAEFKICWNCEASAPESMLGHLKE